MIRDVVTVRGVVAVVGREPSDAPFPFGEYVAICSARDNLGPVVLHARHLPYGVWWDRLRPTVELVREGSVSEEVLPLDGAWNAEGWFVPSDDPAYTAIAASYDSGDGLF